MNDTRTAILDTAERLFAENDVQGVSVRTILKEAGVNIALAHYHFGGREGLIREVLRRRIVPLNERRMALLDEVESDGAPGSPTLDTVLRAFLAPVVDLLEEHPHFARMLGRLMVTADDGLRWFFMSEFMAVLHRFSEAIKRALPPGTTDFRRHSRGLFMVGSVIYLLTNSADLKLMSRGRYEVPGAGALLDELVEFCAAGLTAGEGGSTSLAGGS